MISHSVIAVAVAMRSGCPVRHPSPQNSSGPRIATTASLPLLGNNGDFDLAFLDVEHRIRRTALREDRFVLSILGDGSAAIHGGEKYLRVKRTFFAFFVMTGALCERPMPIIKR